MMDKIPYFLLNEYVRTQDVFVYKTYPIKFQMSSIMSFAGSASDISSLVSIITTATSSIESFYKNSSKKPVPTLDDVDSHPLDVGIYLLEVKHSVQMLEGACTQLCATLSRPNHTMLSVYNHLIGNFLSLDYHVVIFEGTTNFNSSPLK